MTDDRTELSAADKAQISANLRLTRQFVRELIEDPERHEILPDDATVVLLPPDDAPDRELTHANLELAKRLAANGERPILWSVGLPAMTGPRGLARAPIFREDQLAIRYDRPRDVLTVAFSETDRPTMPMRHHPFVISLVDPETHQLISYRIPNFLAALAPRSLAIFDLLLLSTTQLIGITREEILEQRMALDREQPLPTQGQAALSAALKELMLLSA